MLGPARTTVASGSTSASIHDPVTLTAVFNSLDSNGNGWLELEELQTKLRHSRHVALSHELRAGSMGAIATSSKNAISLRSRLVCSLGDRPG